MSDDADTPQDEKAPCLSVVFLPPNAWPQPHDSQAALDGPARNTTLHHLAQLGVKWKVLPPTPRPWNLLDRGNPFWRGIDPWRTLKVLLFHRKADAIISVFEGNALLLLLLRRLFIFKPKVLLWDASPGNPWRVLQKVQSIVLPRYDGLMMLTTTQIEHLQSHYKLTGATCHIGYNVDEQLFAPIGEPSPQDGYILSVGDDLSRDYPTLLTAAAGSNHKLVLKTRWRPEGETPANVTFLSGRLDDAAFIDLYAKARLVILPLKPVLSAGGITSLFEAMAMGKPVIASASSITKDFVVDDETGVVVPPGDVTAMRKAMDDLSADTNRCRTLGQNARTYIQTKRSTRQLAMNIKAFVQRVASRQPS